MQNGYGFHWPVIASFYPQALVDITVECSRPIQAENVADLKCCVLYLSTVIKNCSKCRWAIREPTHYHRNLYSQATVSLFFSNRLLSGHRIVSVITFCLFHNWPVSPRRDDISKYFLLQQLFQIYPSLAAFLFYDGQNKQVLFRRKKGLFLLWSFTFLHRRKKIFFLAGI